MDVLRKHFSQLSPRVKIGLILGLIILFGAWLRLSDFGSLARFNADQVRDARVIDSMFDHGNMPLLGPKAGGTTFNLGPAFYYLEYASAVIFGQTPEGMALFIPLLSIASILVFFLFFHAYFSPYTALLLTFLYASSLYAVRYSRFAWNPNATPFFLFSFLFLLLILLRPDTKKPLLWYTLIGIIIGIGMQLHTTLLLLMPTMFFITHIYLFFQKRSFSLKGVLIVMGIVFFFHLPLIAYDLTHQGKNITSFFQGTEKKTAKTLSLSQNILLDTAFFFQGNTYALTGIQPQKNWIKIPRLLSSKNAREISLFIGGVGFFLAGLFLAVQKLRRERDQQKKEFLLLTLSFFIIFFVLCLPIAQELNVRFFIVIIFLPFLFLGLIFEYIMNKFSNSVLSGSWFIIPIVLFLFITNMATYTKIYSLDGKEPGSAYGGISLGEATTITQSIKETIGYFSPQAGNVFSLAPFEFKRSIDYLAEKANLPLESYSQTKDDQHSVVFLITWNEKTEKQWQEYACCYTIFKQEHFERFSLTTIETSSAR